MRFFGGCRGTKLGRDGPIGLGFFQGSETFHNQSRTKTNLQTKIMALNGIPLQHEPDRLREFQTLIRHVHQQPTQMRRALRLAFKELPVDEAQTLRDWVERRFSL